MPSDEGMRAVVKFFSGVLLMPFFGMAYAICPDGYTTYLGVAQDGVARNSSGVCAPLCKHGWTQLLTSAGMGVNLFSDKTTSPSINIGFDGGTCYVDLVQDKMSGTLNVLSDGKTYHAVTNLTPCPEIYTLSFDCGEGATGTPPPARTLIYGELYNSPDYFDGCVKPGYSFAGWKIDSLLHASGVIYRYTYAADKTMVAQWTKNTYAAPIFCNYCSGSSGVSGAYMLGAYDSDFTPPATPSCVNPYDMTVDEYQVLDAFGNDTGDTLAAGKVAKWKWDGNVQLSAKWSGGAQTMPVAPIQYTLSYDCGDGATGTPPESHGVGYKLGYFVPHEAGGCRKPGYYLSGWKIDNTSLLKGQYKSYTYTTNKTMVAQWAKNTYAAVYICDNGSKNSAYISVAFGGTVTPSATVCTALDGATFGGYAVYDALGNNTGNVIAAGESVIWDYPYNIQLRAIWNNN